MTDDFESSSIIHRKAKKIGPIGRNSIRDLLDDAIEQGLIERSKEGGCKTKFRSVKSAFAICTGADRAKADQIATSFQSNLSPLKGRGDAIEMQSEVASEKLKVEKQIRSVVDT